MGKLGIRLAPSALADGRATLEAHQVTFSFNGTPVLNQVDLCLEADRMIGVIGPNGAGKSTLVRLLSRLLTPAQGRIRLNGHSLASWRPADLARVLAVVPQSPELPPAFTAWELVLMGRTPYMGWMGQESEQDRAIARQAMEETSTYHLANRLISQLSGGEQQRVVVARALTQEPRVLLLDEPTAHLDINHQVETLSLITRLVKERNLAALAIFHDLNLAAQYCGELVLLDQGQIAAQGTPHDVLTPPVLQRVYGIEVAVGVHPQNGLPVVFPICGSLSN
ncbi:MAG: heme ABC transporter ATP-binding protein [Chloroflexi bacterium]|nr:MAG: heme ABC transporter ATP-binding protein [Anaerolineaceae bacterium 4572_32.2]RLC76190.1 MAG: heme ABC transporter ATP-binding protein [Chloroflexota bacterium]RLC83528.1 MAG: heme ABC transporter ATP-binding protein [Chloroflexota bacterium]HEY73532.1 heme ABC transporter ATP-binding protein [Thermoflexia bacterium]